MTDGQAGGSEANGKANGGTKAMTSGFRNRLIKILQKEGWILRVI